MPRLLRIAAIAALCCQFGSANAAAFGTGLITQIGGQGLGPNLIYFGISPVPVNRASCNIHGSYQFVVDISTADGKALYSTLLMARASGLTVSIQGTGNCPTGASMESVSYWSVMPE